MSHNAMSHDTNDCKIFRQQIQLAIEQGKLKFETPTKAKKPMKIDQHPFPTNTVEMSSEDTSCVKLLTSESAQNKGAGYPKVQATAADVKRKGLLLEEEDIKPRRPVTSQMLINKFQWWQDKAKGREEWAQHNEGHCRCSFFKYCWEEGIKLPKTENCLECNGAYNNSSSTKRICFNDRRPTTEDHREFNNQRVLVHQWLGGKASIHDRLGGNASVHDRLGGRVNEKSNNQLEEIADSLVPDEDIMCRAPKRRRTLQLNDEGSNQSYKKPNPQRCPDGLTKSQKRRV
jgi:hypothetical protein